jgi:hypothetical protein
VMTVVPEQGMCQVMVNAFQKGVLSNRNLTSNMKS